MAMVVQHNAAAQLALGELNKNNDKLKKSLEKVSSGQKINSAKDDSASFCISEKMREQIRTLNQDHQNVQNGSSLFKIADGGINSIVDELRNLKELAINSANDTNTDIDRAIMQKEFSQRMANINDIATETNYNGKRLLDGTYARFHTGDFSDAGPDLSKIVHSGAVEPTGSPTTISNGNYTISTDGVYELAAGYTGTITINAQNVKITQAGSGTLNNVYMIGPSGGNANLWIEDLNINNSQSNNFIKFQGADNHLNFKGTSNIADNSSDMATIHVGDGLTVEGGSDGTGVLKFSNAFGKRGSVIGTNKDETAFSGSYVTVNSGNFYTSNYREGAFIGAASFSDIGDITINGGYFEDTFRADTVPHDALIGGGDSGRVGNVVIDNATIKSTYVSSDPVIGIGGSVNTGRVGKIGDITISNSYIYYRGVEGAAVGTGKWTTSVKTGNITIEKCDLDIEVTGGGAGIGTGTQGTVDGNIKIIDTDLSNVRVSGGGEVVGRGVGGIVNGKVIIGADGDSGSFTNGKPLKIHHGPKANQATNFYINDMHTKSLGTGNLIKGDLPKNDEDLARYDALSYDSKKQDKWLETLRLASNKNLDQISVTTQKNANVAILVIDGAIEYAINEATYVGSYLQRLEYTGANLVTMGENVQASESAIRDADMAKEMTAYTKYNILTQSAQAMLAQANQNGSAVLSLLQ